jgi:LPXTG-site transpeptidase (sortase) family protein
VKGFIRLGVIATSLVLAALSVRFAEASDAVVAQTPVVTQAGCQTSASADCDYASGDRLIIPSLQTGDASRCGGSALNANVNVYDVGSDLQMGVPVADCDVVRQNFAAFPGVGGYPGDGGTTVLAGHVDYHPNYQAVFWYMRNIQVGAEVRYQRADGRTVVYSIDWAGAISDPNYDWGSLVASSGTDNIVLITCDGVFNAATHEYSNRFVAHGVIVQ